MPCPDDNGPLDFETLLEDRLTRLLMDRDGVTPEALRALLEAVATARAAAPEPPPA